LTQDLAWRIIWEQDVGVVVTILSQSDKDDLSTLSECKKYGDISVAVMSEDILMDYTVRSIKVRRSR